MKSVPRFALRPLVTGGALLVLLAGCAAQPGAVTAPAGTTARMATPSAAAVAAETRRLNDWFNARYEELLQFSPMELTFLGRKERLGELDDLSIEAEERILAWRKASVEDMEKRFDYALLSEEAKRSHDVWKYQYERAAEAAPFRRNAYAFDQMNGLQSFLPTFLISFHPVESDEDAVALLSRLGQVPRALHQQLSRAHASAAIGIRPPRFAYEGVIDQAQKVVTGAPFDTGADSPLWADLQRKVDALATKRIITSTRADDLKAQGRALLTGHVKPAYDGLIAWFRADMPNAAVNPTGVSTQQNGKAYYKAQLAAMTTTSMTAEEIHATGLAEVARLRREMTALKEQAGFEGDLNAFFTFLATDARFRYPNTDAGRKAYLDDATAAINNIKKVLPEYFGLLPKADLEVRRVEPFREQDGAAQHYFPGTPDGGRPGIYYAHLSDMNAMPKTELEVIAYHEGLPGHHLQLSIAQELTGIPTFRTQASFTAYVEGWGLYSEWLAKQMPGTYTDPYSNFGRLTNEMWRAVRLVVDTGLHAKGWTEEQAVKYFDENTSVPLAAVRSEIRRYLVMPGQATSYKIGMMKIQSLRANAEKKLGSRFDIRSFHDVVLGGGALPLEILEQRVEQWVAAQ